MADKRIHFVSSFLGWELARLTKFKSKKISCRIYSLLVWKREAALTSTFFRSPEGSDIATILMFFEFILCA